MLRRFDFGFLFLLIALFGGALLAGLLFGELFLILYPL